MAFLSAMPNLYAADVERAAAFYRGPLGGAETFRAEQVRSVAVERVSGRLGELTAELVTELDRALRIHLSL
jgi:mRNA-degrading endonuclease toxin of MazEF toxin-antitoxin module